MLMSVVLLLFAVMLLLFIGWILKDNFFTYKMTGTLPSQDVPMVLFDFDGTLCDSQKTVFEIFNRISSEFGFRKIGDHEQSAFRDLDAKVVLSTLGVSELQLPFIVRRVRKELESEISALVPFPGVLDLLWKLRNEGFLMGLMTSNGKVAESFLKRHEMLPYFSFIVFDVGVFAKAQAFKEILNRRSTALNIYVGDETRDSQAALKAKMDFVAVSWGYNSRKAFERHPVKDIADDAEELFKCLRKFLRPE